MSDYFSESVCVCVCFVYVYKIRIKMFRPTNYVVQIKVESN